MKEIYVYKKIIGGWIGLSKEEADAKIEKGYIAGVQLVMERGEDEPIKITLLKDSYGFCGFSDEEADNLATEYFDYVESITGIVTKPA